MPRAPEHEHSDDADLRRWFAALGPPPTGRASPLLRASVLAQIEQRRTRHGVWRWMPQWWSAVAVPVLAVGLVLSLAVNIWWGIGASGRPQAPAAVAARPVQAYRFLADIQSARALGTLVATNTAVEEQLVGLGFASADPRVTIFRMGMLYTDALATLHGGTTEAAARRVGALLKAAESIQAPRMVSQYLKEMHTMLQHRPYTNEECAKFLALFETLYEAEYGPDAAEVQLFRLAGWLESMSLAAMAGDRVALRQAMVVPYIQSILRQFDAPSDVLQAIEHMHHLLRQETLTDRDMQTLLGLVRTIQRSLGALPA